MHVLSSSLLNMNVSGVFKTICQKEGEVWRNYCHGFHIRFARLFASPVLLRKFPNCRQQTSYFTRPFNLLLKLVITKRLGVRARSVEGSNALGSTLCFA